MSDVLKDGFTAYESRFLKKFEGPLIPMGAEVTYKPSSPKDLDNLEKYGEKTLPGIFVGYHQLAGGQWSGDFLVADWEQIGEVDTAREINLRRVKEIVPLLLDGKIPLPTRGRTPSSTRSPTQKAEKPQPRESGRERRG